MLQFHSVAPALELDACKSCGAVWFDPQEFEAVPEGVNESADEGYLRGIEAQATARLEQMKPSGFTDEGPDETWKTIPALFGFPVETNVDPLKRQPLVTWSLSAVIAFFSIWAFFHLKTAVGVFGFVPAEALRFGGLTWLTSFFLHGGILHLIGNLYFLLIFGDNVEDHLGRWRYALLILAATLTGDLVHVLAAPQSTVPSIGASGGISGVIVFYALQFPKARLAFLFRYFLYFRWLQIPAWAALVLWMLLQFFTAALQLSGLSNTAATAHLGGAAAGFLLWLKWRKLG